MFTTDSKPARSGSHRRHVWPSGMGPTSSPCAGGSRLPQRSSGADHRRDQLLLLTPACATNVVGVQDPRMHIHGIEEATTVRRCCKRVAYRLSGSDLDRVRFKFRCSCACADGHLVSWMLADHAPISAYELIIHHNIFKWTARAMVLGAESPLQPTTSDGPHLLRTSRPRRPLFSTALISCTQTTGCIF